MWDQGGEIVPGGKMGVFSVEECSILNGGMFGFGRTKLINGQLRKWKAKRRNLVRRNLPRSKIYKNSPSLLPRELPGMSATIFKANTVSLGPAGATVTAISLC